MNQRLVDQQLLPNEFLRLIGQRKIFHLRFGNRRYTFNTNDVLIHNVTEDTTMQPVTLHPLSKEITMSSTTVSSSTSTAEITEQSYKRKGNQLGELFLLPTNIDIDPRELDEVPIKLLKKKSSPIGEKMKPQFGVEPLILTAQPLILTAVFFQSTAIPNQPELHSSKKKLAAISKLEEALWTNHSKYDALWCWKMLKLLGHYALRTKITQAFQKVLQCFQKVFNEFV
ncbi:hypothetical protein DVH24_021289 [Malus domestica]|uniref:Uncharacterized protein n=1 Tax=Malus domestica TaxID=3750 RepID=A0A498HTK4_MALDO|nr:hypothetical protein DVH24_021289 [Malus domestica]